MSICSIHPIPLASTARELYLCCLRYRLLQSWRCPLRFHGAYVPPRRRRTFDALAAPLYLCPRHTSRTAPSDVEVRVVERPCREPSLPFADSAPSLDLDWPREQRSTEVPVFIYEESPERAVYCAGNLLELLI